MKIFSSKLFIALALPLMAGFMSCERTIEEPEGPRLLDLFGPFEILESLTSDQNPVDFSAGESVNFSASQLTAKNWTLTITGDASGAEKVFTGQSDEIDVNWDGSTTNPPLFRTETVTAVLSFDGQDTTLSTSTEVTGTKVYDEAYILEDFEGGQDNWDNLVQSGATLGTTTTNPAEGTTSLRVGGVINYDFFVAWFKKDAADGTPFPLGSVASQVYFNFMTNTDFLDPSLQKFMLIDFQEDDNGDGEWTEGDEDMFRYRYDFTETGWQIENFSYADAALEGTGVDGDGVHDSDKIVSVRILVLQDLASTESVDVDLDFLTFTNGGPLQP